MAKIFFWKQLPRISTPASESLSAFSLVAAQILYNRGLTAAKESELFLHPDFERDRHDPYLFKEMSKAVERIGRAVEQQEKIVVHGDYDADGVCSSAVVYLTLVAAGANVDVYLPHRDTEGYGLNPQTVQTLADIETNLIITVDCGISNHVEVEQAAKLGIDVIVTDHHSEPVQLPTAAFAVINPALTKEKYPCKNLAGVGVAYKLCEALVQKLELGTDFAKWLLDVVAISTVADSVALLNENRLLVKYGLKVLKKNKRLGLQKLFQNLRLTPAKISTHDISYKIAPHLNAAGRIDHANTAFELLVTSDAAHAATLAAQLALTNKDRQRLADQMTKEAQQQAEQQKNDFAIVVAAPGWPIGLLGLVAGRLSAKYQRPAFVVATNGAGDAKVTGSGRSISAFDLMPALNSMADLFHKYGGHPRACGFSLARPANLAIFTERIKKLARESLLNQDLREELRIEMELKLAQINWSLMSELESFAPFGEANPEPQFLTRGAKISAVSTVGSRGEHLKFVVQEGQGKTATSLECISFGLGKRSETFKVATLVDLVYTIEVNEWNSHRAIQLNVRDVRLAN